MTYLFLDLETSGLDPARDSIVEIGWVLTDDEFNDICHQAFLVEPKNWSDFWTRVDKNEIVRKMHTDSGLLADLANPDVQKISLDAIYGQLEAELDFHGPSNLAGFSVGFDEKFLLANDFTNLFQVDGGRGLINHRVLDLSSTKLMLKSSGLEHLSKAFEVVNPKPHRALADCYEARGYAMNYQHWLKGVTQ